MNTPTTIDWDSWEVEAPPPEFADRVVRAVVASSSELANTGPRRRTAPRTIAILSAAAVAAASFAVLATVGRSKRRVEPERAVVSGSIEARAVSDDARNVPVDIGSAAPKPPTPFAHAAETVVDRKLRDELRAKLMPPLEARGVEVDPHTGLTIPAGATGPAHNLTRDYIQARVREDFFPLARACYENALAKTPQLRGRIVVDFMIVGDSKVGGIVDQAKINEKSDITDPEFATCMRESMLSMVFEPPENNGWMSVSFPIAFAPDDEEEVSRDQ